MYTRILLLFVAVAILSVSCKKKEDDPAPVQKFTLRTPVPYDYLFSTTPYNVSGALTFFDVLGDSTVDRTEGRVRLRMLKAIDAYAKTSAGTGTAVLDATVFSNMFSNTGSPFTGDYTDLNTSTLQIRNVTASSKSDAVAAQVRADIEAYFPKIATASNSVNNTASNGQAGKLGNYLVDEDGIEWGQVIAKSLIGGFQVDYIGNKLLGDAALLNANNTVNVNGKKYTALEHRWDEAYGTLTTKDRYAADATSGSNGGESFLGAYVWEYNKSGYPNLHLAFLRGRAAIVNNDRELLVIQAQAIRRELEKTMAAAALGYLNKWKTGTTDAARAHAIGEGMGFIYSLRFCSLHGGNPEYSDQILDDLIYSSPNGFWDLTNDKINDAIDAIESKF